MTAPNSHVRVAGTWKKINKMHVRVGGQWKLVNKAYVRVGGVWKLIGQGVTPGSITYTAPGTYNFSVPAHNFLQVELWGSGASGASKGGIYAYPEGNAGNPSTWDGGSASGKPQANGGGKATGSGVGIGAAYGGPGGTAVNGDVNMSGSPGGNGSAQSGDGSGGASPNGGATRVRPASTAAGNSGNAPGGGGSGSMNNSDWSSGGGAGAYCKKTYASGAYSVGASVPVVVGIGASPPTSGVSYLLGGYGAAGQVKITWS